MVIKEYGGGGSSKIHNPNNIKPSEIELIRNKDKEEKLSSPPKKEELRKLSTFEVYF